MLTKITVEQAFALIDEHTHRLASERVTLKEALGSVVAEEVRAPLSLPPFDNSAVDGFALSHPCGSGERFRVVSTLGAGDSTSHVLQAGEACRIMTGAKLPAGAKCVVMQEDVERSADLVLVQKATREAQNIRRQGEDVSVGTRVLDAGMRIVPQHVGLLSALGVPTLSVVKTPSVAIISTGSELVSPGEPLLEGQVYYCTGPMLEAQCRASGGLVHSVTKVVDDLPSIVEALVRAANADVVIMVGGMAGGLFDHGRAAFEQCGVTPVFYEGQWRPGKPLFFGTKGKQLYFGLPGNPVAAFVMFKVFIEPALMAMKGFGSRDVYKPGRLLGEVPKTDGKALFLRGQKTPDGILLVPGQGSHQLFSLSQADTLVWAQPNGEILYTGIDERFA